MSTQILNQLDKQKKELIYNLEPDEFTKLINELFIKYFDYFLTQTDITNNKIISEDFSIREQKANNITDLLNDIVENMPNELINKTNVAQKVDLNQFREYQVNRLGDLLNENFQLLEKKELVFNIVTGFLQLINNLTTLQVLILFNKGLIPEDFKIVDYLSRGFKVIDYYIDFLTNPDYEDIIQNFINETTLELIKKEIANHNNFLKDFPAYKELYEKNKGKIGGLE